MDFPSSFSERFKELIGEETYEKAAERLNISRSTISSYITGARSPKTPVLKNIARAYNVDPVWLLGGDVPKYKEVPASGEDLSDAQKQLMSLVATLSDEEASVLHAIADQVLSLRGGKPDPALTVSDEGAE